MYWTRYDIKYHERLIQGLDTIRKNLVLKYASITSYSVWDYRQIMVNGRYWTKTCIFINNGKEKP